MVLWSIFWRTFAQMLAPFVVAAMAVDWATDYRVGASQLALGIGIAAVASVVAVVLSLPAILGPATSALGKAVRSFFEKLGVGLGAVVINEFADFVTLPRLLVPVLVSAVLAAGLTYFQNQAPPAPVPA